MGLPYMNCNKLILMIFVCNYLSSFMLGEAVEGEEKTTQVYRKQIRKSVCHLKCNKMIMSEVL